MGRIAPAGSAAVPDQIRDEIRSATKRQVIAHIASGTWGEDEGEQVLADLGLADA